ncbi:hypothetical protein K1719_014297 [Acacia pycnantha]|nr:hypothetical protein K1719_014297 [Acacia pycnantha]
MKDLIGVISAVAKAINRGTDALIQGNLVLQKTSTTRIQVLQLSGEELRKILEEFGCDRKRIPDIYCFLMDDINKLMIAVQVKALAWCPFQGNLLATGGGSGDRSIKFWNTRTGACLNSVDTGSQVCALLWNKNEKELLSSHGFTQNQLTLWKYPSMVKLAELDDHTSRVLHLAQPRRIHIR